MNREELQEVVKQLEALEALAKLFNSLWFEQIRRDITDSKVQAYLMVFEDAFPNLNHVIEFARKSAAVLTDGPEDKVRVVTPDGVIERRTIQTGMLDGAWVEVVDGVSAGEYVILEIDRS